MDHEKTRERQHPTAQWLRRVKRGELNTAKAKFKKGSTIWKPQSKMAELQEERAHDKMTRYQMTKIKSGHVTP